MIFYELYRMLRDENGYWVSDDTGEFYVSKEKAEAEAVKRNEKVLADAQATITAMHEKNQDSRLRAAVEHNALVGAGIRSGEIVPIPPRTPCTRVATLRDTEGTWDVCEHETVD